MESNDEIQILKVEGIKKKTQKWVSSSFGGLGDFGFTSTQSKPVSTKDTERSKYQSNNNSGSSVRRYFSEQSYSAKKRPREDNQVNKKSNSLDRTHSKKTHKNAEKSELWLEKHKPQNRSDLAVHKKKVEDVAEALKHSYEQFRKFAAPIFILTGPPGAGKTALIKVLANEMDLNLQEWTNSSSTITSQWSSQEQFKPRNDYDRSRVDVYSSQSQSSQFQSFLLRANKYRALDLNGTNTSPSKDQQKSRNLILVEDLPNVFHADASQLQSLLIKYRHTGHCPLVFIITETNSNSFGLQKLLPKDLQRELRITQINVNPVAPTMMVKVLSRIASKEFSLMRAPIPSSTVLEAVAASSGGDIRSAINSLQFLCRKDVCDLKFPATSKQSLRKTPSSSSRRKYSKSSSTSCDLDTNLSIGAKDASVFLFQAVGKILYFKRGDPSDYPHHPRLPQNLHQFESDPLLVNPEEVAAKSHISGDFFVSFLHENHVDFIDSIDDLERCSQYFSDSDVISAPWTDRDVLQNYSVSIATRGFIHSSSDMRFSTNVRKNHGWRPLHKSRWTNASKEVVNGLITARQLFKGHHWDPEILCTEILPFLSLCNPTLHDADQISFVQKMTQFSRFPMFRQERLDEKDVLETSLTESSYTPAIETSQGSDGGEEDIPNSQNTIVTAVAEDQIEIDESSD